MCQLYCNGDTTVLESMISNSEEIRAAWAESVDNQEIKCGFRLGYCNYEQFCRGLITGNFIVDMDGEWDERADLFDYDLKNLVG